MAEKLANFVLRLAEDPQELERFRANPEQSVRESGLSPEEQAVLLSRDSIRIRDRIAAELVTGPQAAAEWVIVLVNVQTTVRSVEARAESGIGPANFSDFANRIR